MNLNEFMHYNPAEIKKFEEETPVDKERDNIEQLFDRIEEDCHGDEQLEEYFRQVVEACYNYTTIVCEYERITNDFKNGTLNYTEFGEKLEEIEPRRSVVHNSTIDSFNILSRLMAKKGKDNSWVEKLMAGGRVAYGNYAIKKTLADVLNHEKKLNNNLSPKETNDGNLTKE